MFAEKKKLLQNEAASFMAKNQEKPIEVMILL
jgi:hypothetical protein